MVEQQRVWNIDLQVAALPRLICCCQMSERCRQGAICALPQLLAPIICFKRPASSSCKSANNICQLESTVDGFFKYSQYKLENVPAFTPVKELFLVWVSLSSLLSLFLKNHLLDDINTVSFLRNSPCNKKRLFR